MLSQPLIAIQRLRECKVELDPGLTDAEVERVQDRVGFTFGAEHREFVQEALPVGPRWPDWRNGASDDLRKRLYWPVEGIELCAAHGIFWPRSWGDRPHDEDDRREIAKARLARVPALVPLQGYMYIGGADAEQPSPIFSIHEIDVIYYGDDLLDWAEISFGGRPWHVSRPTAYVPFWSDMAEAEDKNDV